MARAPLQPTDPERVGRYRLLARLGAGGMGVVYLAETGDGRPVAVKVLRPDLAGTPEFRTRFGREVAALTRVQGVCTVRVIEADTQAPEPFLVTEYADGPSLSEYVDAHGPLDPGMLYGLATGLAEALTAIHAAGIVHRDLKPSNVLLTADGPKVIDFGIAQALDTTSLTRTGMTVGSAGYMAPEQIMGRTGTAADVFTWAVTVAFAAGGRPPFGTGPPDSVMYRIVHEAPDISAVPPDLRPLVQAALAKDPQARPTAAQLLGQLTSTRLTSTRLTSTVERYENPTQTVLAQTWHPPATGPGVPTPGRPSRRRALLPVVLILAFLLAAGGTVLGLVLAGKPASPAASGTAGTSSSPARSPGATTASSAATTPATSTSTSTGTGTGTGTGTTTPASTPASTPQSTPASTVPPQLPVLTVGGYTGMKPTEIAYSGDATNVVTKLAWSSWTATGATGQGTSDIDSCNPNCAQAPPSLVPTTVTLSAPVNGKFTQMTETRNGSTSTYTYPGNWPQSAS